jgi:hypothetical protein
MLRCLCMSLIQQLKVENADLTAQVAEVTASEQSVVAVASAAYTKIDYLEAQVPLLYTSKPQLCCYLLVRRRCNTLC